MKSFVFAAALVFSALAFGCVEDTSSPAMFSAGAAGEAGSGGTGGESPACEPEGVEGDCKCPDGTSGTQKCEDGEFGECECLYYPDVDDDGYGDEDADPVTDTDLPEGHAGNGDDCDDDDKDTYPGSAEKDSKSACMQDADDDGYGDDDPPAGVTPGTDCNDDDKDVNPGMSEICGDFVDNNCNGQVDEGCEGPQYTYCRDADKDTWTTSECKQFATATPPDGWRAQQSNPPDCNDGNANQNPGMPEICDNGIDDDCDGQVDEGCTGPTYTYYRDNDGDTYTVGNGEQFSSSTPPNGYRAQKSTLEDCDDNNPNRNPGMTEICDNGIDDNCNGQVDEGCTNPTYTYYLDNDSDTYTVGNGQQFTSPTPPTGYRAQKSTLDDCADNDPNRHPNAVELCNGVDDDCDGVVDEGCTTGCTDGATQTCVCTGGANGSQSCVDGDWAACVCGGTTTIKFEVDCSSQPWALNPEPQGSWAGRAYGGFVGCSSTGTGKTACTFTMPAPDYPSFVGQGHAGYGKYAGDASGDSPAPCYTPAQVGALHGTTITLLCSVRLWKDGAPQELKWETNSVIVQDATQSCSESGYFPYYNAVPAL